MNSHRQSRTRDAVILLPGLLGSELADHDGKVVWGLRPSAFARALANATVGQGLLNRLIVENDRPLVATRLIQAPAILPTIASIHPYRDIVRGIRDEIVLSPEAFLPFPYDWRLSVASAARRLAEVAERHLAEWRRHPLGSADARLVLIGHSMGGLVARYFTDILGGSAIVGSIVTLGTPQFGSVKAVQALTGTGMPPIGILRSGMLSLACSMPALYELLPRYACVVGAGGNARSLTADDASTLGIETSPWLQARDTMAQLDLTDPKVPTHSLVGIAQPTAQSISIEGGAPRLHHLIDGEDRRGDGTVYRDAAALRGIQHQRHYVVQRHGALAFGGDAVEFIRAVLTDRPLGPPMGHGFGLEVPEVVQAGVPFRAEIWDNSALPISCRLRDVDTGAQVAVATATPHGDRQAATLNAPYEGIFEIEAHGGGTPVKDVVIAQPPPRPVLS